MQSVLLASKSVRQNQRLANFISKNNSTLNICNALEKDTTINAYSNLKPSVLVLDTTFPINDISLILNEISHLDGENKKQNTIITSNISDIAFYIDDYSKIYAILKNPVNFEIFRKKFDEIINYSKIKELNNIDLTVLLTNLHVDTTNSSGKCLYKGIEMAYYNPLLLNNVTQIYKEVGLQENLKSDSVKSEMHYALSNFNLTASTIEDPIMKLFNTTGNISAGEFIKVTTKYLHHILDN